jgi:hypothetical protein
MTAPSLHLDSLDMPWSIGLQVLHGSAFDLQQYMDFYHDGCVHCNRGTCRTAAMLRACAALWHHRRHVVVFSITTGAAAAERFCATCAHQTCCQLFGFSSECSAPGGRGADGVDAMA